MEYVFPLLAMTFSDVLFGASALAAIILGFMVVKARNPIYCSLFLIGAFFPIAVIYFMLYATFVGIIQLLVYAGAIMVLFTFVIMMIDQAKDEYIQKKKLYFRAGSAILSIILFSGMLYFLYEKLQIKDFAPEIGKHIPYNFGTPERIGELLFLTDINSNLFIFSFELVSLLILLALVGVLILAKRKI